MPYPLLMRVSTACGIPLKMSLIAAWKRPLVITPMFVMTPGPAHDSNASDMSSLRLAAATRSMYLWSPYGHAA